MMRVMMGENGMMVGNRGMIAVAIAATLVVFSTGCVRSGSYNALKNELDGVRLQYETEKIRAQDIRSENRKLKQEIAELDGKFRSWREQLARTEQEWKDTRDDLLRVKIDKEQQRVGPRDQVTQSRFRLIPESTRPDPEPTLQSDTQSVDVKRRLKELKGVVQQIQNLLEQ
jgi:septal ring factor EnvC (AmiA/AmiB activator)